MQQKRKELWSARLGVIAMTILLAVAYAVVQQAPVIAQGPVSRFAGPTSSQPIALDAAGSIMVVANPDTNSISLFEVGADRNRKIIEQSTGEEPNGVAISPDGTRVYVANTVAGTVSIFAVNRLRVIWLRRVGDIPVGTEPYGLALTPNGKKLYVTNARSNTVSVIDTAASRVIKTITGVGFEPRGLAITNDNDENDDDELVYVTQFFATPNGAKLDGEDDSKSGRVSIVRTSDDTVVTEVEMKPIRDTGFKAPGDAIARIAPPAVITEEDLKFNTGAYPNQLNSIALKNTFAYVPSTGASPNGPVRFDVNTQSLLGIIDGSYKDTGATVNMHLAVKNQRNATRLFLTVPWSIAFKHRLNEGYVLAAASNVVAKVSVDPTTGVPTVLSDLTDPTRVLGIPAGRNPRGIVINAADTRAYVMNYVSRDVTIIDITKDIVLATLRSTALPESGTFEDIIHIGKELYNTSVGNFDPRQPFEPPIAGRMSAAGWGSCSSCHPNGLSDNVVWIFGAGPRRTMSQHQDFDPTDVSQMRALNWSGIFDEQEDFEANIRGASGGRGIIVGTDNTTPDPILAAFVPANGNRRQLRVRGVGGWDAIKTYIQFGIRAPISPVKKDEPDVLEGEEYFKIAKCQACHGGPNWTVSRIKFTPAPAASLIVAGQVIGELTPVGTFDATLKTEVRQNAAAPLGAAGYVPPSLMSLHAFPQTFYHNGSANTLDIVMENVPHRAAGTRGVDTLTDAEQRRKLIRFLLSIDGNSQPIAP